MDRGFLLVPKANCQTDACSLNDSLSMSHSRHHFETYLMKSLTSEAEVAYEL